jgi:hypothetical protein
MGLDVQYRVTCYIFLIGAFLYTLVVANPTNTFTPQDLKKKDLWVAGSGFMLYVVISYVFYSTQISPIYPSLQVLENFLISRNFVSQHLHSRNCCDEITSREGDIFFEFLLFKKLPFK